MLQKSWFENFKKSMNVIFSEEDFLKYKAMVEKELEFYKKYLKKGAKIFDIGCGLGCTAIPLSALGYEVVGIDNDEEVVEAAQRNAKTFGGKIEISFGDIFEIDEEFGKESFDACISGGVLEHFTEKQIKELIKKQLLVATLVIASMPIATKEDVKEEYEDYEKRICKDGIYRNLWTADYWINNIFKGFNVLEYQVGKASEVIGGFDQIIVVIGR